MLVFHVLRTEFVNFYVGGAHRHDFFVLHLLYEGLSNIFSEFFYFRLLVRFLTLSMYVSFGWPALAVFIWLPLFALGILIARLLTPLSLIVGRTQWFLKDGEEHPLKAIGYVAAVVVFLCAVAGRAVFST